ncbi:DUF4386 domain-containing protein [Pedobacter caeni]|uniref:DUF4386 domain-containing protein n=1 Tax=Pedobacter caeni TaxID=288992 RepID=A0A1M5LBQ6_9SPHI|nr:DUF4386 domain-containing protein [Pedobacter caeni]SHG62375.1 protein of unknown function [Pedobacter caeni]
MESGKEIRIAGVLILTGMCAGIFSVAPAIDSRDYITIASKNSNQVIFAAVFQFVMCLTYMGTAILLYPIIKKFSQSLSIGFLSFRIVAATLSIIGTVLLLSILAVSQEHLQNPLRTSSAPELLGNVLKTSRDYINHVFMVLVLCTGNYLCYSLLYSAKLIPQWLSVWGMTSAFLSVSASILVLFRQVDIITYEYLALNVPTAIHELVFGLWLTVKGFNKRINKL